MSDKIALQLRTEQFTCELSELNAQNEDLRKQMYNAEHSRSQNNRHKVEVSTLIVSQGQHREKVDRVL